MKRREFIDLGIAAGIVGLAGVAAQAGWLDDIRFHGYRKFIRTGGCGGYQYVWKDDRGQIVHQTGWRTPWSRMGVGCGMARMSEESVSFVDHLVRGRRNDPA